LGADGSQGIYTSDLFFGELKQITHDSFGCADAAWGADGGRIIYTELFQIRVPDIFLIDLASGRRRPFLSLKGTNQGRAFSLSGQQ